MPTIALFAHVTVDEFEIVTGPGPVQCAEVIGCEEEYYKLRVSLKTLASNKPFNGTLCITRTWDVMDGIFLFEATYQGHVVTGEYNMHNRSGWFSSK